MDASDSRAHGEAPPRLAAKCAFLRVTMGERPGAGLVNYCRHIVRDGRECVGPFLDDHETTCGLWEAKDAHAAASPAAYSVADAPGSDEAGEADQPNWI